MESLSKQRSVKQAYLKQKEAPVRIEILKKMVEISHV